MKIRNFFITTLMPLLTGITLVACGGNSAQKRASDQKSTSSTGKESGGNSSKAATSSSDGIAFHALSFGPYLLESGTFSGSSSLLVEAGYFDVRQYHAADAAGGMKDYRGASVAVWGGGKISAVTTGNGCSEIQEFAAGGTNTVSAAESAGFFDGDLKNDGSVLTANGLADSGAYELSAALDLDLTLAGKSKKIADKKLPPKGAISFSKAMYTIFGNHLDLSDVNSSLTNSKRELVFTEDSGTEGFNTVVATAYGSGGKFIRCLFGPGGSATLTKEQYTALLPLKALVVAFGNVELVTENGVSTWTATFAGTAVEDLSVP